MPNGWPSDQLLAARHEGARPAQKALAGPPAHAGKSCTRGGSSGGPSMPHEVGEGLCLETIKAQLTCVEGACCPSR